MKNFQTQISFLIPLLFAATMFATPAIAQNHGDEEHTKHETQEISGNDDIVKELAALRAQVAQLEASLQLDHRPVSSTSDGVPAHTSKKQNAMRGMGDMGGKRQMGMNAMGEMGPSDTNSMGGMGGMMGMGPKAKDVDGNTDAMEVRSDLPGFPGASHIYHIGATGFFLDHNEHIDLTLEQQTRLNEKKQDILLAQSDYDRRIEGLEEVLWSLTAASTPDINRVETEIRAIEALRAEKRLAFIRAVGEAAQILTVEQRQTLAGTRPVDMAAQSKDE
tara:strand:- start:3789 stop:4616 length:828 start_codon:yes stop_codon:yes gene_type:complete